jgi:hypothetical protein
MFGLWAVRPFAVYLVEFPNFLGIFLVITYNRWVRSGLLGLGA